MNFCKKKILILGKKPLPIGGVTIHVNRLTALLDKVGQEYSFYDLQGFRILSFLRVIGTVDYAHLHSSSPLLRLLFAVICRFCNTKSMITYHGDLGRFSSFYNFIDYMSVKVVNIPILINKQSFNKAIRYNKNSVCISAYIPEVCQEKLDVSVENKINELRQRVSFIVCTNASNFTLDKDGNEIYGIKLLVDLFRKYPDWGFIISDPSGSYSKLLGELEPNICVIRGTHSFIPVLETSDCFIRYTSTDGDSLSIHEALDCGIYVIATDVVTRPENVSLVTRGNTDQLISLLYHFQQERLKQKRSVRNIYDTDILKLYRKLFS